MRKLYYILFIALILIITSKISAQTWTQIGVDIDGEALGDASSFSVSLSSDGSVLAIGAPYNDDVGNNAGHVRIYENQSGTWTQIGADINGEAANDKFGNSVSLSSDGSIVAIGAYQNDGNGNSAGHVRIYENQSGTWTQIGADIDGEAADDEFGKSVSLSSDGSVVAVGADNNDGTGLFAGHVRIYENQSGTWTQIGSDIDAEAEDDHSGRSVSLSSDGSVVAIGAFYNDGTGPNAGHVRIYENQSGTWTQIGADIDGEAMVDYSGFSVSLSSDGSVVAIGAYLNDGAGDAAGHVRIYENQSGTWTQIGADIDGEAADDQSGYSVSLSSDGSIVAIGATFNAGTGSNAGHVRIYENQSGTWTKIGTDIDGEAAEDYSGSSVSLSSDGLIVAIGAPYNDGTGSSAGHVRVYEFPQPDITIQPENQTNICPTSDISFTVAGINIDNYQWQVDDGSGFGNIIDDDVYSNATTATLIITDVTLAMNNYQYRCYFTNTKRSATSDTATLTIDNESPVITCIGNQTVDADETNSYTVNGTEFDPTETDDNCEVASIENDFNNTSTLAGEQMPEGTTTIFWTVTDIAGNEITCSFDITVNTFVGIETLQQKGILIYPNPTNGIINFDFSGNNVQKIRISDITGKTVFEKVNIEQNEVVDLSDFVNGIYVVTLQTDKGSSSLKIIKE